MPRLRWRRTRLAGGRLAVAVLIDQRHDIFPLTGPGTAGSSAAKPGTRVRKVPGEEGRGGPNPWFPPAGICPASVPPANSRPCLSRRHHHRARVPSQARRRPSRPHPSRPPSRPHLSRRRRRTPSIHVWSRSHRRTKRLSRSDSQPVGTPIPCRAPDRPSTVNGRCRQNGMSGYADFGCSYRASEGPSPGMTRPAYPAGRALWPDPTSPSPPSAINTSDCRSVGALQVCGRSIRAVQVCLPTMPSTSKPLSLWYSCTAASVTEPKSPSTETGRRRR